MKPKTAILVLLFSLLIDPVVYAVLATVKGVEGGSVESKVLFGLTVVVEIVALVQAVGVRKLFSSSDRGHLTWTLIVAFFVVRLVGELRLITLTFEFVSPYKDGGSAASFFYVVVLRYLYTISDLLFIAALVTTVRAYKSTGLKFELMSRDYGYIAFLWAIPVATYYYRSNLSLGGIITTDNYILTYRVVAVFVGAIIGTYCVVVRRYALQMGGGAVAKVWNTVVVAGIARAASFLVLAMFLKKWRFEAQFAEQYLLWIFAWCWLVAALYQREVFRYIVPSHAGVGGPVAVDRA
jgi:hypothetical protein